MHGVERRRKLRAEQQGLCYWCGLSMHLGDCGRRFSDYPWGTTVEHPLPMSHPDHARPWAVVAAYQLCNHLVASVD